MRIYTIGFTKKSAEQFFTALTDAGVRRLVDVRLNNVSQLAGFAKRDDLAYFLRTIVGATYIHLTDLAPTKEILDAYKSTKSMTWTDYEISYLSLLKDRRVSEGALTLLQDGDCLLCSEATPEHCHRRLVAEVLCEHDPSVQILHLG